MTLFADIVATAENIINHTIPQFQPEKSKTTLEDTEIVYITIFLCVIICVLCVLCACTGRATAR